MIAHAQRLTRRPAKSRPSSTKKRLLSAAAKAQRTEVLRERRRQLFERVIDYIPCRQFLKADAERLASDPPAEAARPLGSSTDTAPSGLTPYLASLYQTRLLTKDEEQFYFRRMNWLKFRAATARGRLDKKRATLRQI